VTGVQTCALPIYWHSCSPEICVFEANATESKAAAGLFMLKLSKFYYQKPCLYLNIIGIDPTNTSIYLNFDRLKLCIHR
jgi:hypothetical protein